MSMGTAGRDVSDSNHDREACVTTIACLSP